MNVLACINILCKLLPAPFVYPCSYWEASCCYKGTVKCPPRHSSCFPETLDVDETHVQYGGLCVHAQSRHAWLCDPTDCSPPGALSMGCPRKHAGLVAVLSSRGPSRPRGQTCVSCSACAAHGGLLLRLWGSPRVPSVHLHALFGFVTHPWGEAAGVPEFEFTLSFSLSPAWTLPRHLWILPLPCFQHPFPSACRPSGVCRLLLNVCFFWEFPLCVSLLSVSCTVRIVERIETLESCLDLNRSFSLS